MPVSGFQSAPESTVLVLLVAIRYETVFSRVQVVALTPLVRVLRRVDVRLLDRVLLHGARHERGTFVSHVRS